MNPEPEIWSVEEWLEKIGMSEYAEGFVDNGYETVELISVMKAVDMDAVGVTNKQHRGILFTQARLLMEETTGIRPPPLPSVKPSPVITLSMPGSTSASPTTPSSTSGYTEPWDNTASPVQSPSSAGTSSEYSEPWNSSAPKSSSSSKAPVENTDSGKKAPPLPPPNKAFKGKSKKPPPSPSVKLPEYKKEGVKGLTKLQLKLKIREELQKDAIVLSEYPYCSEDGSQDEGKLIELASEYAERFGVESLGVYDALKDVWRHSNNKSEFVTPTPSSVALQGGPSDNYDEPFDTQAIPTTAAVTKVSRESSSPKHKKSQTLPPSNQSNYDEPFDTVKSPDGSPEKVRSSKVELSKTKTLPSPKIPKKEAEPESAPKDAPSSPPTSKGLSWLFRREKKSHSVKGGSSKSEEEAGKKGKKQASITFLDKSKNEKSKGNKGKKRLRSADSLNVVEEDGAGDKSPRAGNKSPKAGGKSVRASVAGYPAHNGFSHDSPKRHSSLGSSPSESEESPPQRKKHGGKLFQKFITPPTLKRNQSPEYLVSSSSDEDKTPPALRRLKQLGNQGLTGSDLELSIHVEDEDSKGWMHASRSYDNLAVPQKDDKKQGKKKGFFKRLLTLRKNVTLPATGRKKSKDKKSRDSIVSTSSDVSETARESSLTSSISMPDIAALSNLKGVKIPSAIPENLQTSFTRTPPLSYSMRHSSARSQIHTESTSPSPPQPRVVISSAPVETSFLSSDSVPKGDAESHPVPMVRTRSSGSTKSCESSGSFTKPPPPPKPSTLTRKSTPVKKPSQEDSVSTTSSKTPSSSSGDHSKPAPPPKPIVVKDKPVNQSAARAPTKPARKSIKRGGVTEQKKQELNETTPSDNQIVNKGTSSSSPRQQRSPDHTGSASGPSHGSPKQRSPDHTGSASGPSHGSPKSSTKPTPSSPKQEKVSSEDSVSKPPPKPSRNYKSVKILTRPPDKPAPPPSASTSKNQGSTNGNIKSSGNSSPASSHTPSLSLRSEGSQEERPSPKPRTSMDSNSKRPLPPSKPARKSVKLQSPN